MNARTAAKCLTSANIFRPGGRKLANPQVVFFDGVQYTLTLQECLNLRAVGIIKGDVVANSARLAVSRVNFSSFRQSF
jgi:hypothetical protein